jgi:hypothetical protein
MKLWSILAVGLLLAPVVGAQEQPPVPNPNPAPPGTLGPWGPPVEPAPAVDEAARADLKRALDRIDAQDKELARLKAIVEAPKPPPPPPPALPPLLGAKRLGLSASGFLQVDWNAWSQSSIDDVNSSTGAPLNDERFLIRRARLRLAADYGILSGLIEFDGNTVNGTTARIIGAEVSLKWPPPDPDMMPYIMGTIGLFKVPFGFEVGQSDTARIFLERSTAERAFFPGEYDLGLRLQGGWRFVRYAVAAMNGDPIGEKAYPLRDPNGKKDFVGRVGVDTNVYGPIAVAGGVSGLLGTGFHTGTPATKDVLQWRDTNENGVVDPGELVAASSVAATPSQNFDRFALGFDVRLTMKMPHLGELMIYGELTYASNLDRAIQPADPVATKRDLRELGWYVAATQEITRWAALGVRYDYYNPDADSNDLQKGQHVPSSSAYSTWAFAGVFRVAPVGRFIVEYDHNRNNLGRDMNGFPTNLDSDTFMIRGETSF